MVQRCEAFSAFGMDKQQVFDADAEAPGNINAWLVGKDIAGLDDMLAAGRKIGVLVHIQAKAMTQPVGEVLAVAGLFYHAAGCFVRTTAPLCGNAAFHGPG